MSVRHLAGGTPSSKIYGMRNQVLPEDEMGEEGERRSTVCVNARVVP